MSREIRIRLRAQSDILRVVLSCNQVADGCGFTEAVRSMIATAASELSTNVLKYAGKGELILRSLNLDGRVGIEVVARDRGPGIENIEEALQDHTSTGGTLGLGLPGVRRLADEFDLETEVGSGTVVTIRKWAL